MANIVTRSDAPWAYLPTLAELTLQGMESPSFYKEVAEVKGSDVSPDKRGITTGFMTGLGPLQTWGEVIPVPFDTPDPGRLKTTAYQDFGIAVAISRNAVEDEIYGVNENIGRGLPKSHQLFRDLGMGRLLNNAYATTYYSDDSATPRAILATNHDSVYGTSRSNTLATSQSLSYQSLQDLIVQGWQHLGEKGFQEPMWDMGQGMILMVAPADGPLALKLVSELSTYEPTSDSNAPNVLKLMNKWRVVVNPYITSIGAGNYWFVLPEGDKGIWIVERRAPEISNYMSPDNKAMIVDLTCREAVHIHNVWRVWGSGQ